MCEVAVVVISKSMNLRMRSYLLICAFQKFCHMSVIFPGKQDSRQGIQLINFITGCDQFITKTNRTLSANRTLFTVSLNAGKSDLLIGAETLDSALPQHGTDYTSWLNKFCAIIEFKNSSYEINETDKLAGIYCWGRTI